MVVRIICVPELPVGKKQFALFFSLHIFTFASGHFYSYN